MFEGTEIPSFENNYLFFPDEAYSYGDTYEKLVHLIRYLSKEEEELSTEADILVIETPEGVFVRSHTTPWCTKLTGIANQKEVPLKIIGVKKWTEITRKYRAPIQSFGDNKLAVWRVGF